MKKSAAILKVGFILFVFLLISCSKEESVNNDIEGQWTVVSYENFEISTSITKSEENTWMDYNNGDVTANFSLTDNATGEITGKKVTNNYSGIFKIGTDKKLTVSDIFGTEINEPEWGRMFRSILLAESYEVEGNLLTIFYNDKKNAIILERS